MELTPNANLLFAQMWHAVKSHFTQGVVEYPYPKTLSVVSAIMICLQSFPILQHQHGFRRSIYATPL